MSLSKNEMALSRPALNNLEALKENKNLEQDIVTFSTYSILFELLTCSICKTNHGFRHRGDEFRCTNYSACSPKCLAILIKNGVSPSSSVQPPEAQTKLVQNGFSSLDEPRVVEPTVVEEPPLENEVQDQKIMQFIQFSAAHEKAEEVDLPSGQSTDGLPAPRMVRPKSAAGAEEVKKDPAEVKTGSAATKSDHVPVTKSAPTPATKAAPAPKSPFALKSATPKPTSAPTVKSTSNPAPTSKTCTLKSDSKLSSSKLDSPSQPQKSAPKPPAESAKSDRKWTINDLKLAPVYSEAGGKFMIVYSWDAVVHLLQSEKIEDELYEMSDKLQTYYVDVNDKPLRSLPEPLEVICALFSLDNALYRCVVLKVFPDRESVLVKFLDFGADEEVPLKNCFPVCQEIMKKCPIMGLEFHLCLPDNVSRVPTLDEIPVSYLKDNTVTMKTEGKINEIVWKGQLMFKDGTNLISKMPFEFAKDQLEVITESDNETETLQEQNIQPDKKAEGRVRNPFKKEVVKEALEISSSGDDSGVQDLSPKSVASPPVTPPAAILPTPAPVKQVTSLAPPAASPTSTMVTRRKKPFNFHSMNLTQSLTDDSKVKISFNWTAAKLTIVGIEDTEALVEFEDTVYQYALNAPNLTVVPELNTVVVAPYEEGFYRGRVASKDGDDVTVEFFDLGDSVTVPYGQCLQISEALFKAPVYGVILKIDGVPDSVPATAVPQDLLDKQWTLETNEKTSIFNWVGQLWDEKEVSYAQHVLQPQH